MSGHVLSLGIELPDATACADVETLLRAIADAGVVVVHASLATPKLLRELAKPDLSVVVVDGQGEYPPNVICANMPSVPGVVQLALKSHRAAVLRDQFLSILGHEIRNPLGVILMTAQTIEMKAGPHGPFARERAVIERQAKHLSQLVDDLLDVSRVSAGKITLQKGRVDLGEIAQHALAALKKAHDTRQIDATFVRPAEPIFAYADGTRVAQILGHLLSNAAKFSSDPATITVSVGTDGDMAVLRVRDNGMGLPRDQVDQIFELFDQLDRTLDRARGGLGIGLTLVRGLVLMHGGSVRADSEGPGRGTEITVKLPMGISEDRVEIAPVTLPERKHRQRRVLVVEDNDDMRHMLSEALELLGYQVDAAANGPDGVAQARAKPPAAACIDLGLPAMSGIEVAKQLRAALGPQVLLISLSGYDKPEHAGLFDAHITKPATIMALRAVLARLGK